MLQEQKEHWHVSVVTLLGVFNIYWLPWTSSLEFTIERLDCRFDDWNACILSYVNLI